MQCATFERKKMNHLDLCVLLKVPSGVGGLLQVRRARTSDGRTRIKDFEQDMNSDKWQVLHDWKAKNPYTPLRQMVRQMP